MTGSTHVVIAVAATLCCGAYTGHTPDASGWIFIILGSLAPDIDSGGATIARPGALFGRLLPRRLAKWLDTTGLAFSRLIRLLLGHRRATHWLIWAVGLMLLGHEVGMDWLWWFGFGYLWHILADFCTKAGVPLAGPFWTKNMRWSPLKTGAWPEPALATALWGFILWQWAELLAGSAQDWIDRLAHTVLAVII
ncbi:MAG: metal-dependent hydrolase [Anaerolineae bacterium]|nr:metal-dependent hydrolase [Anaerolineae bacterium]